MTEAVFNQMSALRDALYEKALKNREEHTFSAETLEELIEINDRLFGEAATDYKLAAELDDRRITVEDRLMQLYEEEEKGISIDN